MKKAENFVLMKNKMTRIYNKSPSSNAKLFFRKSLASNYFKTIRQKMNSLMEMTNPFLAANSKNIQEIKIHPRIIIE